MIQHITIMTKNYKKEIKFFEEIIGFEKEKEFKAGNAKITFLKDGENTTKIEIIENKTALVAGNENISLGFKTEDLHKKREEIIKKGYDASIIVSPVRDVEFFFKYVFQVYFHPGRNVCYIVDNASAGVHNRRDADAD